MGFGFFKKKDKCVKMSGRILAVDDNQITIRFVNTIKYKKGQFVTIGISKQKNRSSNIALRGPVLR